MPWSCRSNKFSLRAVKLYWTYDFFSFFFLYLWWGFSQSCSLFLQGISSISRSEIVKPSITQYAQYSMWKPSVICGNKQQQKDDGQRGRGVLKDTCSLTSHLCVQMWRFGQDQWKRSCSGPWKSANQDLTFSTVDSSTLSLISTSPSIKQSLCTGSQCALTPDWREPRATWHLPPSWDGSLSFFSMCRVQWMSTGFINSSHIIASGKETRHSILALLEPWRVSES